MAEYWEWDNQLGEFNRKVPLTVCIAAICNNNMIVGASDRMMTSGDIEFEPDLDSIDFGNLPPAQSLRINTNNKIFPFGPSVVVMTAGDSGLQTEIVQEYKSELSKRVSEKKAVSLNVKDVVDEYVRLYNHAKLKRLRSAVFAPWGLDECSFAEKQASMSKDFVQEIIKQAKSFDICFANNCAVETIVTGIDASTGTFRPHIYSVIKSGNGDAITCYDSIGFAAIGSGARHAESQFMLSGHSKFSPLQDAVLLTVLAKKRSEVAPGVGEGTDMFTIGPDNGPLVMLRRLTGMNFNELESICKRVEDDQAKVLHEARASTKAYLDKFLTKYTRETKSPNRPHGGQS